MLMHVRRSILCLVWDQLTNCVEMVGRQAYAVSYPIWYTSYPILLARNKIWLYSHERIMGPKVSRFRDVLFDFPYINLLFGP